MLNYAPWEALQDCCRESNHHHLQCSWLAWPWKWLRITTAEEEECPDKEQYRPKTNQNSFYLNYIRNWKEKQRWRTLTNSSRAIHCFLVGSHEASRLKNFAISWRKKLVWHNSSPTTVMIKFKLFFTIWFWRFYSPGILAGWPWVNTLKKEQVRTIDWASFINENKSSHFFIS